MTRQEVEGVGVVFVALQLVWVVFAWQEAPLDTEDLVAKAMALGDFIGSIDAVESKVPIGALTIGLEPQGRGHFSGHGHHRCFPRRRTDGLSIPVK
jgi:hypothetical protein